jgi:MHS family proline/betaine transporter-like MFS transporter
MITVLVLIAIITNAYIAPNASFKAEVFPLHTRGTGMSLGYNIGVVIFGGATPLIATWLIRATGTPTAPSLWLIVAAVLSIIAVVYGSPFAAKHASGVEEP